ncbi:MAG: hypothetical protein Q4G47_03005, partial [Lachnospiraceae bacterium]|nr:hypothetical protein [Lachnospiraceae bacterium]
MQRNNTDNIKMTFAVMLLGAAAAIAALTGIFLSRPHHLPSKTASSSLILSPDIRGAVLTGDAASISIRPSGSLEADMELTFSGENITPEGRTAGGLLTDGTWSDSPDLLTTSWFPVAAAKKSLYIIGGLNCAVWEFEDASGARTVIPDDGDFMDMESVDTAKRSWSAAGIPEDAVRCRVTYRDESLEHTAKDTGIMIAYGSIPDGYTDAPRVTVHVPGLRADQTLTCDGNEWTLWDGEKAISHPDLPSVPLSMGTVVTMDGDSPGELYVE